MFIFANVLMNTDFRGKTKRYARLVIGNVRNFYKRCAWTLYDGSRLIAWTDCGIFHIKVILTTSN